MSVLGIGGPELILIVVLVILILGPERAPQAAKAIGRQWRTITSAEWWTSLLEMWRFMRNLPQNLAEFSEVKEIQETLSTELEQVQSLTKGIQSDVESISKPVEAILGGTVIQDTMQEMSDELTQSLPKIGGSDSTSEEAEAASEAVEVAAEAAEVAVEATEVAVEATEVAAKAAEPAKTAVAPASTTQATKPTAGTTMPKSARLAPGVDDPGLESADPSPEPPPPAEIPSLGMGQEVDDQMLALAEQISEQIDQLPAALVRLEELENQQSELESQIERLQQTLDLILEQPKNGSEDEAQGEPSDSVE